MTSRTNDFNSYNPSSSPVDRMDSGDERLSASRVRRAGPGEGGGRGGLAGFCSSSFNNFCQRGSGWNVSTKDLTGINDGSSDPSSQVGTGSSRQQRHGVDDPLLARELSALSLQERQRLFDEINGTADTDVEEPEFVAEKLQQMELEIQKLRHRSAYNRAQFLAPRRVKDDKFRLMFLRSERFDAARASKKYIKHFEYKQLLFGADKVAKDITLEDLNASDQERLRVGATQILPCTDTAGRPIFFCLEKRKEHLPVCWESDVSGGKSQNENVLPLWTGAPIRWKPCTFYFAARLTCESNSTFSFDRLSNAKIRVVWYQAMACLEENVNAQRRGFVFLVYNVGAEFGQRDMTQCLHKLYMLRDGLPWRPASLHFCYDDVRIRPILSLLSSVGGTEARLRLRDHFGADQEVQYELMRFGIAPGLLPVDSAGNYHEDDFERYLEDRKSKEERKSQERETLLNDARGGSSDEFRTDYATERDVILGRGKPYQDHPGNLKLANYIEEYRSAYVKADRLEKTCISWKIVQQVKNLNGRFLKMDEDSEHWVQVSDDIAREKVSHGFRTKHKGSNSNKAVGGTVNAIMKYARKPSSSEDDDDSMDTSTGSNKRMKL